MNESGGSIFLDTNVLLYSVDRRIPEKHARSREWLNFIWQARCGQVSWQVLHEFYSNSTHKLGHPHVEMRRLFGIYAEWNPVDSSFGLIKSAWHWIDTSHVSYWDALIIAAAERSGSNVLLTEDLQDGQFFNRVRVVNPFHHQPAEFGLGPKP